MTCFYAMVDENALPIAWYNDDVYPPNADGSMNGAIPPGAVTVSQQQWQECIDNPGQRAIVNGTLVEYSLPAVPLAQQKTTAIAQCIAWANDLTAQITWSYPQSEIDSWPAQLIEARLVQAGTTPPAPSLLQAMVTAQNDPSVTLQSLATAVIAKAAAYQSIVAAVQAVRMQSQAQLNAVTDPTQISGVLESLLATASAQAQALGLTPAA